MARQNQKNLFSHIWRAIVPQHLFFMRIGVQLRKKPFFQLSESDNRIKNLVSIKSCGCLKMVFRFSIFSQKVSKIVGNWELSGIFFKGYCIKFDFSSISLPLWAAGKNDQLPRPSDTRTLNRLCLIELNFMETN